MIKKPNDNEEFNKIFDEATKKKPEAEIVVGFGSSKNAKKPEEEEMPEETPEETQESEKVDVNSLIEIIKNSVDFDDLKAQIEQLLAK